MGACRKSELYQMRINDIQDLGQVILVNIPDYKTNISRNFTITGKYCQIFKKYLALRPPTVEHNNLFLNYHNGKCTKQVVGINKFGTIAKNVATYLKLKDPQRYTGHCIRRNAGTMLLDSSGDLIELKRHGASKSHQVAEEHIENSVEDKLNVAKTVTHHTESSVEISVSQPEQNIKLEIPSTSTTPTSGILSYSSNKLLEHYDTNTMPNITISNCSNVTINLYINGKKMNEHV